MFFVNALSQIVSVFHYTCSCIYTSDKQWCVFCRVELTWMSRRWLYLLSWIMYKCHPCVTIRYLSVAFYMSGSIIPNLEEQRGTTFLGLWFMYGCGLSSLIPHCIISTLKIANLSSLNKWTSLQVPCLRAMIHCLYNSHRSTIPITNFNFLCQQIITSSHHHHARPRLCNARPGLARGALGSWSDSNWFITILDYQDM